MSKSLKEQLAELQLLKGLPARRPALPRPGAGRLEPGFDTPTLGGLPLPGRIADRASGRIAVDREPAQGGVQVFYCIRSNQLDPPATCGQPKCNKPEVTRCGFELGHAAGCGDRSLSVKGPTCAPNCRRGDRCNKALCGDHKQADLDHSLIDDFCPAHAKWIADSGRR